VIALAAVPAALSGRIMTIDGPTAAGKTTAGRTLAPAYRARMLDTGLTYRSAAHALTRNPGLEPADFAQGFVHRPGISGRGRGAKLTHPCGTTPDLWDKSLADALRAVSADPAWRATITGIHRAIIHDTLNAETAMIVIGRDTATALAPDAVVHVFLTADQATRATRRSEEFRNAPHRSIRVGDPTHVDDQTRAHLTGRANAAIIDTTHLFRYEVAERIVRHIGDVANAGPR